MVRGNSRFSSTYAVRGMPPSSSGGRHSMVADVLVVLRTLMGPCGLDGGSGGKKAKNITVFE